MPPFELFRQRISTNLPVGSHLPLLQQNHVFHAVLPNGLPHMDNCRTILRWDFIPQGQGGPHCRYKTGGVAAICVPVMALYLAYRSFASTEGTRVTAPDIQTGTHLGDFGAFFTQQGHTCNRTFLFQILLGSGLANDLSGAGVNGNPFSVNILLPADWQPPAW